MNLVVGVADRKISANEGDEVVTYALGSCLGIAVYDAQSKIGGILHVMMPQAGTNPEKAMKNPFMFVDTGVPQFFQDLYALGVVRDHMVVKVAGGATSGEGGIDRFAIGRRNYVMLKRMFWQNGILIEAEDVGGSQARSMFLEIGSGRLRLKSGGQEKLL